jgi:hypothetical protein
MSQEAEKVRLQTGLPRIVEVDSEEFKDVLRAFVEVFGQDFFILKRFFHNIYIRENDTVKRSQELPKILLSFPDRMIPFLEEKNLIFSANEEIFDEDLERNVPAYEPNPIALMIVLASLYDQSLMRTLFQLEDEGGLKDIAGVVGLTRENART